MPSLHKVDTQHRPERHDRTTARRALLGLMRLDQCLQPYPRHDHIYLGEKHLAPHALLLPRIGKAGTGGLLRHRQLPRYKVKQHCSKSEIQSFSNVP